MTLERPVWFSQFTQWEDCHSPCSFNWKSMAKDYSEIPSLKNMCGLSWNKNFTIKTIPKVICSI